MFSSSPMNALSRLAALALALLGAAPAAAGAHLFILSGQSNMERLSVTRHFTPRLESRFGKDAVLVVKDALSGQPIQRWHQGWTPPSGPAPETTGDLYDRLLNQVRERTAGRDFDTVTFLWMQGERDARLGLGAGYEASLRAVIAQLKHDLGREDLNLVIGRLSDFDLENAKYPHWTIVREAHMRIAESSPRAEWVDTDDLNDLPGPDGGRVNDLHYSRAGYAEFGARLAAAAIRLIEKGAR
jgi:hypothetical protein